jgi:mutator protein MutT
MRRVKGSGKVAAMSAKQIVVGAAIVDGDRLLAAQRAYPEKLAGKWELPGGKVDPGEPDEVALLRECREELGVELQLGRRVGRDWPLGDSLVMRVWLATVASGAPQPLEHADLRWLTVDELHDVEWLTPDLPIVEKLASLIVDASHAEVRLRGGNVGGAVRVGATVRRPAGSWTPAVHALLSHLHHVGLDAIPRVLGVDDDGREILEYVPGDTADAHDPWPAWVWSDALLVQVARWLRRYHDAVASFRPRGPVEWRFGPQTLSDDEIVCHFDVAPYNVVVGFDFSGGPVLRCVLDWDVTGPGKPLDDVAHMAWNFLPCFDEDAHPDVEVVRRLLLLADAYAAFSPSEILEHLAPKYRRMVDAIHAGAAAGDAGMQNLIDAGHAADNAAALEAFVVRLPRLRALLTSSGRPERGVDPPS